MRDEEFNEIMPVENGKLQEKKQGELDENAIQAMKMIVGLSQEVSRANAEKYRAQAEITIAEIEKNKQNESEEIAGYYRIRMQQGADVGKIIAENQKRIQAWMEKSTEAQSEEERAHYRWMIEEERINLNDILGHYADEVSKEQNTRIENSKPRNKGLFGFLKRK